MSPEKEVLFIHLLGNNSTQLKRAQQWLEQIYLVIAQRDNRCVKDHNWLDMSRRK
jgi:hypothetical protein